MEVHVTKASEQASKAGRQADRLRIIAYEH